MPTQPVGDRPALRILFVAFAALVWMRSHAKQCTHALARSQKIEEGEKRGRGGNACQLLRKNLVTVHGMSACTSYCVA
jgi:hypothetical protein